MHGERDLKRLLASLEPVQRAGRFVFAVVDDQASLEDLAPALADAGLSCNVIAGYHHDHLLVPADRAPEAITVLSDLSRGTRRFS